MRNEEAVEGDADLTPTEASEIGKLIEGYVKSVDANELSERLAALERRNPV